MNTEFTKKIFKSIDYKHEIETNIITHTAWFSIIDIEYENCKTFVLLLQTVVEYFRKNDIYFVNQYVNKNDIEFFDKSEIINYDDGTIIVKTKIDNFIDDIVHALGIKLIT
jgi:hypothetical protein